MKQLVIWRNVTMRNNIILLIIVTLLNIWGNGGLSGKTKESFMFKNEPYLYIDIDSIPRFNNNRQNAEQYIISRLQDSGIKESGETILLYVIIDCYGGIKNVSVKAKSSTISDQFITDIVNGMPKWKPGILNNKSVDVRIYIPIKY